ncbi:hypothetical protein V6N12_058223 [Hibiscus sabdariffa]|uniref:Uncharacterized protein n=1 Tax=Hibiscus sabdariffa TaxID=183260 RepID=A0ABR2ERM4_9ROSI
MKTENNNGFSSNSLSPLRLMARGIYTSSTGALKLEYNINYNSRSLNKSNFIKAELLSAETCTPREYSDSIVIPVEIPSLPRPRISADILFSVEMSFLLVSKSFKSELLQYNILHLDPTAFGFCQG